MKNIRLTGLERAVNHLNFTLCKSWQFFLVASVIPALVYGSAFAADPKPLITPAVMPRIGQVDERFLSFNVEMLEVTGGNFWKPYIDARDAEAAPARDHISISATEGSSIRDRFHPPRDLGNPRLRRLAAALGPSYMRVSGSGANATYFFDSDKPAPKKPPTGFDGVLTRSEWKGVVGFSQAVDAQLVTSFANSVGTRDPAGVWTPLEAGKLLAYTKAVGGKVAAAEFMDDPTAPAMNGAPSGYNAAAYGRDLAIFRDFMKRTVPDMVILGPDSGEEGGTSNLPPRKGVLTPLDLLSAAGPAYDVFSYHFYGAASKRCAKMGMGATTNEAAALTEEWLSHVDKAEEFYSRLRDRFAPGKRIWITEMADSTCGGNPWASTFRDTFRYVDQLGRMAKSGVQVIMHNSLDVSDYGLLDENTFLPRPNYWAAFLWHQFMGTTVLDPGPPPAPMLHLYAHNLRGVTGGVALLVINLDQTSSKSLNIATAGERYTLSADSLIEEVRLNGSLLELGPRDALPTLSGTPTQPGLLTFPPVTITFLVFRGAGNTNAP